MKKLTDPDGVLAAAKQAYLDEVAADGKHSKAARTLAAEYMGTIRRLSAEQGAISPP